MAEEIVTLIKHKGLEVLIRRYRQRKYQIGIRSKNGVEMWIENGIYNNLKIARTSGKEYASILIDKMLISRKRSKQNA